MKINVGGNHVSSIHYYSRACGTAVVVFINYFRSTDLGQGRKSEVSRDITAGELLHKRFAGLIGVQI